METQCLDKLAEDSQPLCQEASQKCYCGDREKSIEEIIEGLTDLITILSQKLDILDERFNRIEYINKKINEIHALHFPKDALEKEKNLTEKFLAEILLGIPRKRKK
ncbi:MAG: hypothetical protein V4546_03005 [Bacteroidota bacterium]|uniref:Uncharacterized protein n=1 Tax=Pedobacter cryotolerans TaxID=2571270 RepID=A0A4U1C0B8_9SPHI|nr:hypothetical protein [Pedobacter cryotolerans]TKB97256.1 hypothetical protein FA045_17015 [Pedobacter cryotolerans]